MKSSKTWNYLQPGEGLNMCGSPREMNFIRSKCVLGTNWPCPRRPEEQQLYKTITKLSPSVSSTESWPASGPPLQGGACRSCCLLDKEEALPTCIVQYSNLSSAYNCQPAVLAELVPWSSIRVFSCRKSHSNLNDSHLLQFHMVGDEPRLTSNPLSPSIHVRA